MKKYGAVIPANLARAATKKYAENLLDQERFPEWIVRIAPWAFDHTADDEWTLNEPMMSRFLPSPGEDKDLADFNENCLGCFSTTLASR